ncbi:expressed unknown protein [Seminavis robusta]|uniref:SET domain-containing protein n=1 Tax=Seminavis robusta TaxID=568900 RepID=A0A9N8DXH3_9STRA|nr:expressed unknown protein [Seminavis robusta]|eukprot:Sro429_g141060.1 n/a (446) ;mRNA; r:27662-28999
MMKLFVLSAILSLPWLATGSSSEGSRNVLALSEWAQEQGIVMHSSLKFKEYKNADDDDEASSNWGLELAEAVKPGTVLLQVPRQLCLEASALRNEFEQTLGASKLQLALDALGPEFAKLHEDNFWIVLKLFQLCRCQSNDNSSSNNKWSPWIQAIPRAFTRFNKEEQECLPYYAKYAAEYQDQKFDAFCKAAAAMGELSTQDNNIKDDDTQQLLWAFQAVGSRFWKTQPPADSPAQPTSELVPIGDMFNHREPPNVKIQSHQDGSVNFIYDGDEGEKDLYITYGQSSNPHRFLVIFGFCPTAQFMPTMWSQLTYPDNPFSADVANMVFQVNDNDDNESPVIIPRVIWDAVLYALDEPPKDAPPPTYTVERHNRPHVKKYTRQVLEHHVAQQLSELAACREKIETMGSTTKNMELIRQHNAFVTGVFERVEKHLQETSGQDVLPTE